MRYAKSKVGCPYVYGGTGPCAFDCSGLAYAAYHHHIPRTSYAMYAHGHRPRHLRIGDVVFRMMDGLPKHVGVYVGHGRVIHSPGRGRSVQYTTLRYTFQGGYYRRRF